jgi:hypothetical protein
MRKFGYFAATAAILAGFGGWIASTSQARVAAPMVSGPRVDAMQMMTIAANLPSEHFADYSLVHEWDVNGRSAGSAENLSEDAMKKIVLGAAVAASLLFTLAPRTAGFPTVHQEEIEQQRP